jgi:ERCC4-related helicase
MLLDNENKNLKVHEWVSKYTEEGKIDIVTGYFTVGALAYLSIKINERTKHFRLVLGDIVNFETVKDRTLDLLNENITIEAALQLNKLAHEAVEFLKQNKVEAKTLEPNFCHAKAYLHKAKNDDRFNYFISGSSNLTEAGIGLKTTNNIELNIAETGNNSQYKELASWFENLWNKPQAHKNKTLINENGKKYTKPFKQYLIEEIERIFVKYTPKEIYYKVLFELFGSQILDDQSDPEFNRQVGRLENSIIYNTLYDFQQKGVLSLIRMLQKYNGAILADAVGLGKTWSALAIIKFFKLEGREVILLCPKKLQHNWQRYLKNRGSKFEKDKLDFNIRFHTDLVDGRMDKDDITMHSFFTNDDPKLFVIDESHNLRNDKSKRYKFFVDEILKQNEDVKVLMLTATPINTSLNDIRNQFKLIVQGNSNGFDETLGIKNIDYTFRTAQKTFNDWRKETNPRIGEFIKKLPANFFTLTDSLTVVRTRLMIEGQQTGLIFPEKAKPDNIFVTPKEMGNFESFEELFDHFPPMLSGYQPAFYAETMQEKKKRQQARKKGKIEISVIEDEVQRDKFLVKMMYILLVKRLESSWFSFKSTVEKILQHHQNALNKIKSYENNKKNTTLEDESQIKIFEEEDLENMVEELTLGKKRKISLTDIDKAGNIKFYKKDLKKDIDALDNLLVNMQRFAKELEKETIKTNNHKSIDDKIEVLIEKINTKRKSGANNNNQKVLIFTVYRDTADYLFKQLKARGFNKIAVVSGTGSKTDDSETETKYFEPILERFTPYTKLFKEKEWAFEPSSDEISEKEKYNEWMEWIAANDEKTYSKMQQPIDILIATDALSEGQNLQDADMVVNYDIHWNPVRIIQRMGRIDRLGTTNKKIFGINFWPSNNINSYLNLQGRIEQRMAAMKLAGSEVQLEFSDSFKEMADDENLENKMKARMLKQMQTSWDDIEISEQGLGFDDLSLERYRQDLLEELKANQKKYEEMPNGVYTGFIAEKEICPKTGIIALLGYPAKPPNLKEYNYQAYDLIYIDINGEPVLLNQKEVLDALNLHKEKERFVPDAVDIGEKKTIQELVNALSNWVKSQGVEEEKHKDGTTEKRMGKEAKDLLSKLKTGDGSSLKRIKQNLKVSDKYKIDNFDLITWFLIN